MLSGYRQRLCLANCRQIPYPLPPPLPPAPAPICTSCPGHLALFAIRHLFVRFFTCMEIHLLLLTVASPTPREPGHSSISELSVGGMNEQWWGAVRVWRSDRFGRQRQLRPTSCVTLGRSLSGRPFPAAVSPNGCHSQPLPAQF